MSRLLRPGLFALALLTVGACSSRGRELFIAHGCAECHRFRGAGGGLGPDLSDIALRMDAAAIRTQITNPAAANPASRMPAFDRLGWFELRSIVAYLRS